MITNRKENTVPIVEIYFIIYFNIDSSQKLTQPFNFYQHSINYYSRL